MKAIELKKRISEIVTFQTEAEKRRFELLSNKRLRSARINPKEISTDKEVREAWIRFNKYEADWEKYCRASKHEARFGKKHTYGDYSHLAYNGVADDF